MNKKNKLDYNKILLKDPLFTEYSLLDVDEIDILNLLFFEENMDAYNRVKIIDSHCIICKKDTTFNSKNAGDKQELSNLLVSAGLVSSFPRHKPDINLIEKLEEKSVFVRVFKCPRNPNDSAHNQIFIFRVIGTTLIKIGQHPSLADLSQKEIKKYRKLNERIYKELNSAVGLASHGVGVGSFVYLRRILENYIVKPRLDELIKQNNITVQELSRMDFKKKIGLIKSDLPQFLTKNTRLYSVLSKGLHELKEEDCKKYFPILRKSIEIILDEKIEFIERQKKNAEISNLIKDIK